MCREMTGFEISVGQPWLRPRDTQDGVLGCLNSPGLPPLAETCVLRATRAPALASALLPQHWPQMHRFCLHPWGAGAGAGWVCRSVVGQLGMGEGLGKGVWMALILPP